MKQFHKQFICWYISLVCDSQLVKVQAHAPAGCHKTTSTSVLANSDHSNNNDTDRRQSVRRYQPRQVSNCLLATVLNNIVHLLKQHHQSPLHSNSEQLTQKCDSKVLLQYVQLTPKGHFGQVLLS